MWRFYGRMLLGVPKSLWEASGWWSRVVQFALLAGILIPGLSDVFRRTLTANLYWITLGSSLVLLLFGMLRSNYIAFRTEEKRATDAESEATGLRSELATGQNRAELRDSLGSLLMEGQQIQRQCANEREPAPSEVADEWAANTEAYLSEDLDTSYIARFRNGAGLPMAANSIASIEHRNVWAYLYVRLARLTQFIEELSRT